MFESRAPGGVDAGGPRLLADVGGTHARLGWQAAPAAPITRVQVFACGDYGGLEAVVQAYLQAQDLPVPASVAIGIANPVTGDGVRMTNLPWTFSATALRKALGARRLLLLNDFTALALALPGLSPALRRQVGGGVPVPGAAIGLVGPGTGLGISGLLPSAGRWVPISGEGGHATLAAVDAREFAVVQRLRRRYGHVSAERVLSGPGLVDLYHALADVDGVQGEEVSTAAEVLAAARATPASRADQALDLFCGFLGSVAGDLALTLGAHGGVYIGGGIVPRLGDRFDASPFRARFEAKGRFTDYLREIPTWVIDSAVSPALEGAARALDGTDSPAGSAVQRIT